MIPQKNIKSLRNSDDKSDPKAGRNDDNTLGIPRANLELKHMTYVHIIFIKCS